MYNIHMDNLFTQKNEDNSGEKESEKTHMENSLKSEVRKMREISLGDIEILYYLINKKTSDLIEKKKRGEITREDLLTQRKILDEQIIYKDYSTFKEQELISAFSFEGDDNERRSVLEHIKTNESISQKGGNQKGIFDLPGNKIVKIVSSGNYPYELPLVKLTKDLSGSNIVKTYDVFEKDNLVYVIQDKALGKHFDEYSEEEQKAIPQAHYDNLVKLINTYAECGIGTDPSKISNLLYDPEKGFTVIDLGAVTYQRGLHYHIDGYFANYLSKKAIEAAIEKYGEYKLQPTLPTLQDKLKKLHLFVGN